jgi:hypothetical protein
MTSILSYKVFEYGQTTVSLVGLPSGEHFDVELKKINFLKQSGLISYNSEIKSLTFSDKDYKIIIRYIKDDEEEEIKNFLRKNDIGNYKINSDYSIDVIGDVKIRIASGNLPVKFSYVTGSFDISGRGLLSLSGCPKTVGGDFICASNMLTDLKMGPKKVGRNYNAKTCGLSSIEGSPEIIRGDFICSQNLMVNLIGGPTQVIGSYHVDNCLLQTLEGSPYDISGDFDCSFNFLQDLKGGPEKVGGLYDCSNNEIKNLNNGPQMVGVFKCNGNKNLDMSAPPMCRKIISDDR